MQAAQAPLTVSLARPLGVRLAQELYAANDPGPLAADQSPRQSGPPRLRSRRAEHQVAPPKSLRQRCPPRLSRPPPQAATDAIDRNATTPPPRSPARQVSRQPEPLPQPARSENRQRMPRIGRRRGILECRRFRGQPPTSDRPLARHGATAPRAQSETPRAPRTSGLPLAETDPGTTVATTNCQRPARGKPSKVPTMHPTTPADWLRFEP